MKLYLLPLLLLGCANIDESDTTSSKSETVIYSTGGKTSAKSTGGSATGGSFATGGTVVINSTGGKSTGGYTSVSVATGGNSTGGYTSATGGYVATGGAAVVYPICPHYNMLGKRYDSQRDEFNQLLARVQNNMDCDGAIDYICQISEKVVQRYVCWQPANEWLDHTCLGGEVDGDACVTDVDILSCGICICVNGVWKKTNNDYDSPSCRH